MDSGPGTIESEALPKRETDGLCPSARELEVLKLIACGLTNFEIAARLGIARRTVDHHVAHVITKLGAANRTSAVSLAMKAGLIDLP